MSLFTKDFLKDSGISNEEDNQFYLHQNSNFNADPAHQNGFGLQGYGAHGLSHLGQQPQRPVPTAGNIAPQQMYRPGEILPQQDALQFLNNSASANRPNPFPTQAGIIGGGVSAIGSGRIGGGTVTPGPEPGFAGLGGGGAAPGGRFPGHSGGGQFSVLGGRDEDYRENDDFPALPSSGSAGLSAKHDGHLGGPSLLNNQATSNRGPQPPIGGGGGGGSSLYASGLGGAPGGLGSGLGGLESSNLPSSNSSLSGATSAASVTNSQLSAGLLGSLGITSSSTPAAATAATATSGLTKESRYAMAGLLETIRSQDKDAQVLALGTDLTTFGLNLNSAESLYTSFLSPFVDALPNDEPQYKTPQCYMMAHTPMLKADHWSKLTVETLFYIFYQMPRDILQAFAAQELYRRDWKYHGELRVWVKPHVRPDLMQQTPQFVYFDAKAWEQKYLNPTQFRGNLLAGLLPEEEIRVKAPLPGPGEP